MSSGQKPRWPAFFPRMKVRGLSRHRPGQFWIGVEWEGLTSAECFAAWEAPRVAAIEAAAERFRPAWEAVLAFAVSLESER